MTSLTSDIGTFETCRRTVTMSVYRGNCRTCGPAFSESGIDACANESDAETNAQIIDPLGIGTARRMEPLLQSSTSVGLSMARRIAQAMGNDNGRSIVQMRMVAETELFDRIF